MSSIKVNDIVKMFGDFTAVDHVSFDVEEGEIFGLLGPNGAGKSTLIRMLATLSMPTSGTASIGGLDIIKEDSKVRTLIGLVSEKLIMYDRLTAKENLEFFGKLYGVPDDQMKKSIVELLELVQMTKWENVQVGTYSTGMRQRINIIRALLNKPKVLFLDEPTLGLDPQTTVEIREFIRKINQESGVTVILTTHMMAEADLLCKRIGIIDHGKIAALDTPSNLKKTISGGNGTVLEFIIPNLDPKILATIKSLGCVTGVSQEDPTHLMVHTTGEDAFDLIIDSIRAINGKIASVSSREPTLEDVFLQITGHEVRDSAKEKIQTTMRGGFLRRAAPRVR
ncbi:MAG: ATP-binding cassette domain-containing protein [Candidatus Bathyarchaeota archaeon]|nr:ATP-binding cassette domain-containing protein [Candidatus Bathyarchaeota archaeon]